MTALQQKLADLRSRIEQLPPSFAAQIHKGTTDLRASGIVERMLKAGQKAPDFSLKDQNGEVRTLASYLADGPLAISFYRGFWCPFCNADLASLNSVLNDIHASGANLVAMGPELQKYSRKIIRTQALDFDVLTDESNGVAAAFGVKFALSPTLRTFYRDDFDVNLKRYNGDDEWALPMPSRFLIDQQGIIQYAEGDPDYSMRPDPDGLIAALRRISPSSTNGA